MKNGQLNIKFYLRTYLLTYLPIWRQQCNGSPMRTGLMDGLFLRVDRMDDEDLDLDKTLFLIDIHIFQK